MRSKRKNRLYSALAVILMVLVVIATATLAFMRQERLDAQKELLEQRKKEVEMYTEQITANEKTITDLESEKLELQKIGRSMMSFIFMQCSENLYSEAFNYMTLWKATGIFTVSLEEYPGKEGCITSSQYQEMCDAGWIPTIGASKEPLTEQYLTDVSALFEQFSDRVPVAIVFGRRSVAQQEIALAASKGFSIFLYDSQYSEDLPEIAAGAGRHFLPFYYSSRKTQIGEQIAEHLVKGGSAAVAFCRVTTQVSADREEYDQQLSSVKSSVCELAQNYGFYADPADFLNDTVRKDTVVTQELLRIEEQLTLLREENNSLRKKINSIYKLG